MTANVDCDYQDDGAGPNSLDCIEENLWLGDLTAATNLDLIHIKKITHILTIDAWPLPRKISDLKNIKTMCIPVTDLPTEDLISHFEGAFNFIVNGLKEGCVLVHCYQGVSRSATIVLAYLMKKHRMSLEKAFELAKSRRRFVQPNPGFMAQLKLYEVMGYKIDRSNMQYKMFRLYIAADRIRTTKILPQTCADVVKPDPSLTTVQPDPRVYRCKKCRRVVAAESNIIPHLPREKYSWRDGRYSSGDGSKNYCDKIYFVEPMAWMKTVTVTLGGKLYCPNPKCQLKLGSYCWTMGCLCPCGTKVSPAFYLVPSKVDKGNLVQNVQMTVKRSCFSFFYIPTSVAEYLRLGHFSGDVTSVEEKELEKWRLFSVPPAFEKVNCDGYLKLEFC